MTTSTKLIVALALLLSATSATLAQSAHKRGPSTTTLRGLAPAYQALAGIRAPAMPVPPRPRSDETRVGVSSPSFPCLSPLGIGCSADWLR